MALPDRLYELRKERALSQEALAEELGVSRQAISKWESAKAMPESDKLIRISEYFDVSLDYLLKDEEYSMKSSSEALRGQERAKNTNRVFGMALMIIGALSLVYWGILTVANPLFTDRLSDSSTITIGGNGIYLVLCAACIAVGAVFLLKKPKN